MSNTYTPSGTSAPWWLKLVAGPGLATLIVLWGMGLIPGIDSPITQFSKDHQAIAATLDRHEQANKDSLRVNRLICRGVWRNEPNLQDQCGQ